ncbi:MAG: hypothetical protein RLZ62_1476 [Bacteroidota bacterium]|jgi:hypothetical protein
MGIFFANAPEYPTVLISLDVNQILKYVSSAFCHEAVESEQGEPCLKNRRVFEKIICILSN